MQFSYKILTALILIFTSNVSFSMQKQPWILIINVSNQQQTVASIIEEVKSQPHYKSHRLFPILAECWISLDGPQVQIIETLQNKPWFAQARLVKMRPIADTQQPQSYSSKAE